jgi:S1-C subfamily serine protease
LAIPINDAIGLSKQIRAGSAAATIHIGATGVLGVLVQGTGATAEPGRHTRLGYRHRPAAPGVIVTDVVAGSPAQQAGLAAGSALMSLDGTAVDSSDTLITALSAHHPGDSVQVVWADPSSDRHSATVTLAPGPPD